MAACDVVRLECLNTHIAPRLPDARPNEKLTSYKTLCPAHDDRDPSLSVSVGERQRIVWYCHAGCNQVRIRAALIEVYQIDRGCLPLGRAEEEALTDTIEDILCLPTKEDTLVRLRALAALRGYRELPRGSALLKLATEIGIGRSQAFEYARRLRTSRANSVPYSPDQADPGNPRSARRGVNGGKSGKPDSIRKSGLRKSGKPDAAA